MSAPKKSEINFAATVHRIFLIKEWFLYQFGKFLQLQLIMLDYYVQQSMIRNHKNGDNFCCFFSNDVGHQPILSVDCAHSTH